MDRPTGTPPKNSITADVVILGAGVAGLAAASELASAGVPVTVLEARNRVGGRIYTLHPADIEFPVELGAEFVHGRPPELLSLLHNASAPLRKAGGSDKVDACFRDGRLSACQEGDEAFALLDGLADFVGEQGDMSFDDFLDRRRPAPELAARARSFVEGFNAADARRIGIAALARQQQAEEEIGGFESSRATTGYDVLPHYLAQRAQQAGARILLSSPVKSLEWTPGEVVAHTVSGDRFSAAKAIVTLPLGVLHARSVAIHPEPFRVFAAADRMEPGTVKRLVLVFRSSFWKQKMPPEMQQQMHFLFTHDMTPAVWWTQHPIDVPMLVGWVGGPKADAVPAPIDAPDHFLAQALRSLERIFSLEPGSLEPGSLEPGSLDSELRNWYLHDWQSDPFALGAYSYAPAGALDCSAVMAEPVDDTLFFAGEHTDITGHWGTVHGAVRSGLRAARQARKI